MAATDQTTTPNKAVVAEFLEVFSSGDVPGILDRLAEDATWWVSGKTEGFAGTKSKEEMGKLLEGVVTVYKGGALRLTPGDMIAEGDRVVVEVEGYAELNNGRVYNPQSVWVLDVQGGKITRIKEYLDTQHAHEVFFGSQ
jgi:ketosteroid isomerase-like protein